MKNKLYFKYERDISHFRLLTNIIFFGQKLFVIGGDGELLPNTKNKGHMSLSGYFAKLDETDMFCELLDYEE